MTAVDYCGRTYFVYWDTIDWLDNQAFEGHNLGVEYSNGKSWHLVNRNPEQQITDIREEERPKEQGQRNIPRGKATSTAGLGFSTSAPPARFSYYR
ncbi:hypothetical protein [Breoghania sp.]|uniref:hypothetical protein n=1 Tax=Breoghania sp. TaxID=2065378 RepID=UPI002619E1F2|nr:hypothetical protein [Breoghania sp.]MDJ0930756.1 hypothetical protein [Breoghania sp.]